MDKKKWVLLIYKLPSEPSKLRIYVWRKFKKLNAQYLQDSVVILPRTDRTVECLRWISEEIKELGGTSLLWEATALGYTEDEAVKQMFIDSTKAQFGELLVRINSFEDANKKEFARLMKDYTFLKTTDYFKTGLREKVETELEKLMRRLNE
ncbi:MAG: Chromate resistance protein ChrB [Thermincolia bacterium]